MAAKFNNFNLDDFTMSADEYCVASTQDQAELCFLRQGILGDVETSCISVCKNIMFTFWSVDWKIVKYVI